jgi:hypothetical protein
MWLLTCKIAIKLAASNGLVIPMKAHDQKFIPEIIDQLIKSGFSFLAPFCLVLPYGWIRLELHP